MGISLSRKDRHCLGFIALWFIDILQFSDGFNKSYDFVIYLTSSQCYSGDDSPLILFAF